MPQGWIKLHRKLINWEWYCMSEMVHLFLHLILIANHKPKKWQSIEIGRGQLATGRIRLSKETGLSEQTIRTCLRRLKSTNEITIKSTSRFSIITICNYDSYNLGEIESNQLNNQQSTSNQPAINQQLTTNKNVKNVKKEKNVKKFIPPSVQEVKDFIKANPELSNIDPVDFWKGYNDGDWYDTHGKPVRNWKLKLRTRSNCAKRDNPVHEVPFDHAAAAQVAKGKAAAKERKRKRELEAAERMAKNG